MRVVVFRAAGFGSMVRSEERNGGGGGGTEGKGGTIWGGKGKNIETGGCELDVLSGVEQKGREGRERGC